MSRLSRITFTDDIKGTVLEQCYEKYRRIEALKKDEKYIQELFYQISNGDINEIIGILFCQVANEKQADRFRSAARLGDFEEFIKAYRAIGIHGVKGMITALEKHIIF